MRSAHLGIVASHDNGTALCKVTLNTVFASGALNGTDGLIHCLAHGVGLGHAGFSSNLCVRRCEQRRSPAAIPP